MDLINGFYVYGGQPERRIKHYSSSHDILLVGEGDFSFSLCLAFAFRCATNIVATSLDTYDELLMKYRHARENLEMLGDLGACLLHGVDATKMTFIHGLKWKKFHRIVFNFPHAGFHGKENNPDLIEKHKNLVRGFLRNASSMLWPGGEVHISHKVTPPYDTWKIEDLAEECSLLLIGLDKFRAQDYIGYENKRGSGLKPDDSFRLGECRTFKFKVRPTSKGTLELQRTQDSVHAMPLNIQIPVNIPQQPVEISRPSPLSHLAPDNAHSSNGLTSECHRIFGTYLSHAVETFGSTSYDVSLSVREALRLGFETYRRTTPERPLSGYIGILQELHSLSTRRSEQLRQMLIP